MAPSHASSDSSEADEPVYPHAMASSLAGLPVRPQGAQNGAAEDDQESTGAATNGAKAQSGQLKDFLDLATTRSSAPADISARLEQKRIEHEKQRELQKRAFEEQMKQLELQQEQEERELMERVANGEVVPTPTSASPAPGKAATGGPVRSQSGNDLASFGEDDDKKSKYANAKSMPGSRRHSGEIKAGDAPADGQRRKGTDGQPMLNSFLFDDELDTDLQNAAWGGKYLQMNTDDDKFPVLHLTGPASNPQLSASSAALDLAPLSRPPLKLVATSAPALALREASGLSSRDRPARQPLPPPPSLPLRPRASSATVPSPTRPRRPSARALVDPLDLALVLDSSLPPGAPSAALEEAPVAGVAPSLRRSLVDSMVDSER
ncbi:hypothetical protein BCR35DRAFT_191034 [Leucosporidium creatinivorum]|uniref:Uncharacterized protein n=1 Tax=Leucosporidium creatinivorum TaxID=106004 RepID=A0A1Y2FY85_9BASI|nr:hypothetical protein BCR35DRAFT_191034 [Leucosporidium creatinivorum]